MALENPARLRAICQAGKEVDPGWYVIHRRWSIYLTWLLLHTSITPNQITMLMMATGVIGAALLAPASGWVNLAGFLLLYLAFLLDKVDGEVARYRKIASARGLLLDRLHHLLVEPLVFLGAAWHCGTGSAAFGAWNAAWGIVVLGNVVDEHQHLSAYILFKHLRATRERPEGGRRVASPGLRTALRLMRPLKGFRMFIVAVPALALAYGVQEVTRWPAIQLYLYASVAGLALLLAFQAYYYFQFKLEAEIGEQAEFLAGEAGEPESDPGIVPDTEPRSRLRAVNRR